MCMKKSGHCYSRLGRIVSLVRLGGEQQIVLERGF